MTFAIAVNELRGFSRNGVFVALAVAMLALSIAAAALSIQRMATFERERAAAEQTDREVFLNQGERNPHSAAHFSRYAFKPIPALASFDPGITDYAGIALWMEAHYQNPAVFRRAEDLGDAGRFADLSPAWILQYAAPLFLFLILFAAIAGEREQGTLRQMLASGVTARNLAFGKLLGAAMGVLLIVGPALLIGLLVAGLGAGVALPDTATRVFGLVLTYAAFLLAVGGIALGISAFAREKRTALLALVAVWAAAFVFLPRMAATLALAVHPLPDATALSEALSDASRTFSRDDAAQAQMEQDLLSEYGVDDLAELPFNFGGYRLQYSEEYAHPLFEAFYSDVDNVYRRQERVIALFSLLSPVLALDTLSAGLAGTDRVHHDAFRNAAEAHRREIVDLLNTDLQYNAGDAGFSYAADERLWSEVRDFHHQPPSFSSVSSRYIFSAFVLFAYALGASAFAVLALSRVRWGI
ncbi:MAG: DUF3526 domain-containing protein [Pseudomonadota bacterium]